jgi:hypothetical protein
MTRHRNGILTMAMIAVLVELGGCGEDVLALDASEEEDTDGPVGPCSGAYGTTWYVSEEGGNDIRCNGLTDDPDPGAGVGQDCAFSHPFYVLPPDGDDRLQPGDRLIIMPGDYAMGLDAWPCEPDSAQQCTMAPVPEGLNEDQPTCILGSGWDQGCDDPPTLIAVGGATSVINIEWASHVQLECLELTDGSECIAAHPELECPDGAPEDLAYGENGIVAYSAQDVTLRNLHVHGFPVHGIFAAFAADWTLDTVQVSFNGGNGIDLSSDEEISPEGEFHLTRVDASWNGCSEIEPGEPFGCWSGEELGEDVGAGLSAGFSMAEWWIDDSSFSHNTGTGIEISRLEPSGTIQIDRLRAEGNRGAQLAVAGNATIENSLLLANCEFFDDQPLVDLCLAGGDHSAARFTTAGATEIVLVNNTLYGQGPALLTAIDLGDEWDGPYISSFNNIYYGAESTFFPDPPVLADLTDCPVAAIDHAYDVIYGLDSDTIIICEENETNYCEDPLLTYTDPQTENLAEGMQPWEDSPAIDSGISSWEDIDAPDHDFLGEPRPQGPGFDRGAYENVN